jgi:hypothetical protein
MGAKGAAEIIFKREIAAAADPAAKQQEKVDEYTKICHALPGSAPRFRRRSDSAFANPAEADPRL